MAQEHDPVDRFDIRATSERADDRTLVLKQGEMFAVFDRHGDIRPLGLGEQGLYFEGTRFLSRFELLWNDQDLLLLGSTVRDDNILLAVDLTNPDSDKPNGAAGGVPVPRSTLHVARGRFLWEGTCHERLRLTNHGLAPIEAVLRVLVDADFADVFEVRGAHRAQRGERRAEVRDGEVHMAYTGLDGVVRRMRLVADPPPAQATPTELRFPLHLPPQGETTLQLSVQCLVGERAARPAGLGVRQAGSRGRGLTRATCTVHRADDRPVLSYDHATCCLCHIGDRQPAMAAGAGRHDRARQSERSPGPARDRCPCRRTDRSDGYPLGAGHHRFAGQRPGARGSRRLHSRTVRQVGSASNAREGAAWAVRCQAEAAWLTCRRRCATRTR